MSNFQNILDAFEPISLDEMDSVKLMDRTDTKFILPASRLPLLLQKIQAHYRVLIVGGNSTSTYKTLYFDTYDFAIYSKHHNGNLNRYKIRYRNYVESRLGFLEVKFKNNKGRTMKVRMKQKDAPLLWDNKSYDFILEKTPYDPRLLEPALWVNYRRITLVDREFKERVTIDLDLEFSNHDSERKMENLVIAEVKQGSKAQSYVLNALKEMRVRPQSLSKYCMGVTYIYPSVKKNNFKEKLTALNKIINDDSFKFAPGI